MTPPKPAWLKKTTPCPFYKSGRCHFQDKCLFVHDGDIDRKQYQMRATVPAYRRTPENSVDSFSSSESDDERIAREPIDEHTAAAPSLIFSSIYGSRPNPLNRLQLAQVDLPVSPESLPGTPSRNGQRRPSSGQQSRASGAHTLTVNSPVSSRTPSRPVSASLGIGIGGRAQGLAEVFTALATSQTQATVVPHSPAGSLPSPLSLSPKSPPLEAQEIIVKNDNFTLEQFPFKLALSNQSSLLLNRTTRAAARENARRATSLPQSSASPSPASKRPSNFSAPDRYSITSLSYRPGIDDESFERPGSYSRSVSASHERSVVSRSPLEAEEPDESFDGEDEDEDDGYGEDEPQFVKESPSFEALQPYPRDVSIEPSPDPVKEDFGAPVQEDGLRRPQRRMDSDRKLDHELLLAELEERLGVEPGRRRARSGASGTSVTTQNTLPDGERASDAVGGARHSRDNRVVVPKSGVDMAAARGMLGAIFAKRAGEVAVEAGQEDEAEDGAEEDSQEEEEEEEEEQEEEDQEEEEEMEEVEASIEEVRQGVPQEVPREMPREVQLAMVEETRKETAHEVVQETVQETVQELARETTDETAEDVHEVELERLESVGVASRQQTQGDDLGLGSQSSSPGDQSFLPTDWDIGSLDFDAHPLDSDVRSLHSDVCTPAEDLPRLPDSEPPFGIREPGFDTQEPEFVAQEPGFNTQEHHADAQEPHLDAPALPDPEPHLDTQEPRFDTQARRFDPQESYPDTQEPYLDAHESHFDTREHHFDSHEPPPEVEDEHDEHSDSDHDFSDHVLSDDEPTEEYTELINEQAVLTSSVVLRREIPRETSLPEIAATRSRTGTLQGLARSRGESLIGVVPEETARGESFPEPSVASEMPQVEPAPSVPDSPGLAAAENLQNESLEDTSRAESRAAEVAPPSLDLTPELEQPTPAARTATISTEFHAEAEPPKPRSQLKPLRLSMLYGLGAPSNAATITPISAHSTPVTPNFTAPAVHPAPSALYPTPATAHPTHPGSGTASSIPASASSRSNPRSTLPLPGAEEVTETVSVHGIGRGSFGPESVSWYGSKQGSARGSLGGSMRSSMRESVVHALVQETGLGGNTPSPARRERSPPRQVTTPLPEFTTPLDEEEDVRPLPVIWDDDTEVSSKSGSSRGRRTASGEHAFARSPSIPIPVFEIPVEDPAPPVRVDSLPRYPAFVNVEGNSPRVSEGRSPLPSPRLPNPVKSTLEPEAKPQPPTRTRKWADNSNEDSIGSLPVFDTVVPDRHPSALRSERPSHPGDEGNEDSVGSLPVFNTLAPNGPPSASRSERLDHPRYAYPLLPNTAPLSISPRNASPSMMQEPYEQQAPYTTPLTAPLHLQMRMRMPAQGDAAPDPWMSEHFTDSPMSLSQLGSIHSASSSLSAINKVSVVNKVPEASKPSVADQSVVAVNGYPDAPGSTQARTFGDPGPGPSTMMTYSARRLSAEALGSPILLQSPRHVRVASLVDHPEPVTPPRARRMSRRTSGEGSVTSNEAQPSKVDDEPTLKISSEESSTELDFSPRPASTHHARLQSPLRNTMDELSPLEHTSRFKPLSSPNFRGRPTTPLTAPSPLQILRRNMMGRPGSESPGFLSPQTRFSNLPESRPSRHQHHGSLAPTSSMRREDLRITPMSAPLHRDRHSLTPAPRFGGTISRPGSPSHSVQSAASQAKPLLFFAIAKNSAQEVERLLQVGEALPNDKAGPEDLPALAFTLANEQLSDKTQIVKSLLSHGADPASVLQRRSGTGEFDDAELALSTRIEQGINPAIRYYLNRKRMTIPALQAELLEKNDFGALTRAGFSIIGQDSALDELIRVVAGHCRRQTLNPLVIVFSGGPGCGKSLLASKIGPILHVPTFTVNMTNLRNESSLFNYISMTTKTGSPQIPLVDFLKVNEGQRCVVVLEEIEKAADKTVWHSLLMPWEWGKATVISATSNEQIDIDTTKVIWIATSNSGDDATLKFFAERSRPSHAGGYDRASESALARLAHSPRPADNFTRKDYLQLMQAVRKRLGELLGSSMISRVSSVLPFLPFTEEEVLALASESLSAMREDQKTGQDVEEADWDSLLQQAVGEYIPGEGARSVHRAVQRAFDEITEW